MQYATAADATTFGIKGLTRDRFGYEMGPECNAAFVTRPLADVKLAASIQGPSRVTAFWLNTVKDRVERSIAPEHFQQLDSQEWLSRDIGEAANNFFETVSDLLPSEPYIYASPQGDLIAEFKMDGGNMTSIISRSFVLVFSVVNDIAVEKRFEGNYSPDTLRGEIEKITKMLRAGQNAALAAQR